MVTEGIDADIETVFLEDKPLNTSFHADRAGLGIFWKACTILNI
jgi:hypothetical protein